MMMRVWSSQGDRQKEWSYFWVFFNCGVEKLVDMGVGGKRLSKEKKVVGRKGKQKRGKKKNGVEKWLGKRLRIREWG